MTMKNLVTSRSIKPMKKLLITSIVGITLATSNVVSAGNYNKDYGTGKLVPDEYFVTNEERNCGRMWASGHLPKNGDWYYNNDFGKYLGLNTKDIVRSCIRKDGTGWYFDLARQKYADGGKSYGSWIAQTHLIGQKGFKDLASMQYAPKKGVWPMKVKDINSLTFNANYNYKFEGEGNTHVSLWFVRGEDAGKDSAWWRDPFVEVMLKFGYDRPRDKHPEIRKNRAGCWKNKKGREFSSWKVDGEKWLVCFRDLNRTYDSIQAYHPLAHKGQTGDRIINISIDEVVDALKKEGRIKNDDWLLGLEFQTEIWYGVGNMQINHVGFTME